MFEISADVSLRYIMNLFCRRNYAVFRQSNSLMIIANPNLTRRAFQSTGLAALAAIAMSGKSFATQSNPTDQALNRLTFGANAKSRASFLEQGLSPWLEAQLAMPAEDDAITARLQSAKLLIEYEAGRDDNKHRWKARKEFAPLQYLNVSGEVLVPLIDYELSGMAYDERIRPAREVQLTALIRATHADAQLREMSTQFWHDHFSVNSMRDEHTAAFFGHYDKMLREHAFGNFRAMLGQVARSPSMLFYLNNDASRASPANENFARELFELHTLGAPAYLNDKYNKWRDVPGAVAGKADGYIDQDVYEAARALTGWSVGDGRYLAEGENAPRSGVFQYNDRWHDPYQKRILGVEFAANQGPMVDGEQLLDLVANHPATARFICTKLCRRFVSDQPPECLIEQAVAAWTKHQTSPDQIAQTLRAIVLSPEFSATEPRKLKRPFEFMISFYRAIDAEVMPENTDYLWSMARAGWHQHEFRPPTGHADTSDHWANTATLSAMVDFVTNALESWNQNAKVSFSDLVADGPMSMAAALQTLHQRFTGTALSGSDASTFVQLIADDPAATLPDDADGRNYWIRGLAAFVALQPQFMYR
jgi:uncharacterized protein (DUF1800 family)